MFLLDPQGQAILDRIQASDAPALHQLEPVTARRAYLERTLKASPEVADNVDILDFVVPSAPHHIPVRGYDTKRLAQATSRPALIYFHGGGFVVGGIDTHDVFCRQLASSCDVSVFSVEYRLAPEHPFPAAVDDCYNATRWMIEHADQLRIDPDRVGVAGDSAGANLATVTCLEFHRLQANHPNLQSPRFQLLIYPVTDLRMETPSMTAFAEGYLLTRETMTYFRDHYAPKSAMRRDCRASPLLSQDLKSLPPALVLTAGYDPLKDEGRLYADALSAAGVSTQYVCFERQMHGFIVMGRLIDESSTALALCAASIKKHLNVN